MYKSPIDIIYKDAAMRLDGDIMSAVQEVGIVVDKAELLRALSYDRDQYRKGYCDAMAEALPVVRCRDCKYFGCELKNGKHDCTDFNLPYCRPDDFCSYGVQKEATSTDE